MAYQPKSYRKFLAGTVTTALVASVVAPVAGAQEAQAGKTFTDVSVTDVHGENIYKAVDLGLINGYTDGTFKPYSDIKRSHVIKILARYVIAQAGAETLADYQEMVDLSEVTPFNDIPESISDKELYSLSLVVKEAGIFVGSNNNVRPSDTISRQEMATVLVRTFGLEDLENVESDVTDLDAAFEVHRENINILRENEVTTQTEFDPRDNTLRGQFASFLIRALEVNPIPVPIPLPAFELMFNEEGNEFTATFDEMVSEDVSDDVLLASVVDAGVMVNGEPASAELLAALNLMPEWNEDRTAVTFTHTDLDVAVRVLGLDAEEIELMIGEASATYTLETFGIASAEVVDGKVSVTFEGDVSEEEAAYLVSTLEFDPALTVVEGSVEAATAAADDHTSTFTFEVEEDLSEVTELSIVGFDGAVVEVPVLTGEVMVESVMAVNTNQLAVTFNQAVNTEDAEITLRRGAVVYNADVTFNEEGTVATLETAVDLPAGDYTVTVEGLTEEALVETVTVEAEEVAGVEIISNTFSTMNNATIDFKVVNQYGADMEIDGDEVVATAFNVTGANNVSLTGSATESKISFTDVDGADDVLGNDDDQIAVGDQVRVTISYQGETIQKTVTAVEIPAAADVSFGSVEPLEGEVRITPSNAGLKVPYVLSNQFGEEIEFDTHTANADGVANTETIDGVLFTSSNLSVVNPDTFTVNADGELLFTAGASAGTAIVTAIINSTGETASFTVTVEEAAELEALNLSEPSVLVAATETVEVPFSAVDQYGDAIAPDSTLLNGITFTSSNNLVVNGASVDFDSEGKLQVPTLDDGEVTLTATKGGVTVGTVTLDVQEEAVANSIVSVDLAERYEDGGTAELTFSDITVKDQYGRDFNLTTEEISVSAVDGSFDTVTASQTTDGGDGTFNATTDVFTFTGTSDYDNNEVVEISLPGGTDTFELTLASVAEDEITSYSISDVGVLYADAAHTAASDYAETLTVMGMTSDNKEVALVSGKVTSWSTSAPGVVGITGDVAFGLSAGTSTISAFDGATRLATLTVTTSTEAPVPTSVSFADDSLALDTVTTTSGSVVLTVEDQYGVDITAGAETDGTYSSSDEDVATVAADGTVTAVAAGTAVIAFVSENGLVATYEVTVN
ncbi:S-layer homology domain-containing protein [Jeotgalibacillus aurantiacus]|uniref:S-layer homology domain-containing protein n=1 Tax=Jeotgalibacillus aurantiacus TaxID=2763266 RepID=UPI001D0BA36B|nr:S-layer homology domain-containing protein [Jeotgalibacillus aurantiacus]